MGKPIKLTAADGHVFDAYRAEPAGRPKGGLVVVQEIFGVTAHMRRVTEQFAEAGFLAVAPAMFDRIRPGVELPYSDIPGGRALVGQLKGEQTMADVAAAIAAAREGGSVGIVGFCWGGTIAYLAATAQPVEAAVAYYGGMIGSFLDRTPKAPVMYHHGERDMHVPLETVAKIQAAHPAGIFHLYPAGHGFNCDERSDFDPPSAALAWRRTIEFLTSRLKPPTA